MPFTRADFISGTGSSLLIASTSFKNATSSSTNPTASIIRYPAVTFESRNISAANYLVNGGHDLGGTTRHFAVLATPTSSVRLMYANFFDDGNGEQANLSLANLQIFASVEFPQNVFRRVLFSGRPGTVLKPSGIVQSDPITLNGPAGATIFVRTYVQAYDRPLLPAGAFAQSQSALGPGYPGRDASDMTICGSNYVQHGGNGWDQLYTPGTNWISKTSVYAFGPMAIVGITSKIGAPAIALMGDSEITGTGDARPEQGWAVRALKGFSMPYLALAHKSNAAYQSFAIREQFLSGAGSAVVSLGTNDIAYDRSLASLQRDLINVWAACRSHGCKVYACTVMPCTKFVKYKSTSTNFATVQNQIMNRTVQQELVRQRLNAWLRGAYYSSQSLVAGLFDIASHVEVDALNQFSSHGGLFYCGPNNNVAYTDDGLHLNTTGHEFVASAFSTFLRMQE